MKNLYRLSLLSLLTFSNLSFGFDENQSAKGQADSLWELIEQTKYESLPALAAPTVRESLTVLQPSFNSRVFVGDHVVMPEGRKKIIHSSGAVIRVKYVVSRRSFSGIFMSGAPEGLLRLSLAKPPEAQGYIPGFGLMLFVDNHSPITMLAMPSLNPQKEANLLVRDYLTAVPTPTWTFSGWLLSTFFNKGIELLGYDSHDARALSTADFVKIQANGTVEKNPTREPYALIFSPAKDASKLLNGISNADDFRSLLSSSGNGRVLFHVYAKMYQDSMPEHIGQIIATSDFVVSDFADKKLRFKHPAPVRIPSKEGRWGCFRRR